MTRETRSSRRCAGAAALRDAGRPWGIVTNKATRFSEPLVRARACSTRPPRWSAATPRRIQAAPGAAAGGGAPAGRGAGATCVYVGDDLRDVQAGRAAGMLTVAAAWGYLGAGEAIEGLGRRPRRRIAGRALEAARSA